MKQEDHGKMSLELAHGILKLESSIRDNIITWGEQST
jgi:hypothetical protein